MGGKRENIPKAGSVRIALTLSLALCLRLMCWGDGCV